MTQKTVLIVNRFMKYQNLGLPTLHFQFFFENVNDSPQEDHNLQTIRNFKQIRIQRVTAKVF